MPNVDAGQLRVARLRATGHLASPTPGCEQSGRALAVRLLAASAAKGLVLKCAAATHFPPAVQAARQGRFHSLAESSDRYPAAIRLAVLTPRGTRNIAPSR